MLPCHGRREEERGKGKRKRKKNKKKKKKKKKKRKEIGKVNGGNLRHWVADLGRRGVKLAWGGQIWRDRRGERF